MSFESLSATINANDGVLGVIYVDVAPDAVVPGDQYTISLDLGLSFFDDPKMTPCCSRPAPAR